MASPVPVQLLLVPPEDGGPPGIHLDLPTDEETRESLSLFVNALAPAVSEITFFGAGKLGARVKVAKGLTLNVTVGVKASPEG